MAEYKLPDVGEGLTEAEIVTWKVKVGDVIKVNDIVVEIETAKSLVELPSPYAGTVQALHVPEGETVAVGTPIIAIGDGAAPRPPTAAATDRRREHAGAGRRRSTCPTRRRPAAARTRRWSATAREPRPRSAGRAAAAHARRPTPAPRRSCSCRAPSARARGDRRRGRGRRAAVPATPAAPTSRAPPSDVRVLAKPPVRKLAKDLGVDLRTLTPTGPERHGHPRGRRRRPQAGGRRRRCRAVGACGRPHEPTSRRRTGASRSRASAR